MTVCICGCLDVCMAVYLSAGKHLQTPRVYVCLSGTLSVCLSVCLTVCLSVSLSILTDNVGIYVCVAHIHTRIHLVCVCVCVCLQFYIISGRLYITSIFRNARYTHTHKHTHTYAPEKGLMNKISRAISTERIYASPIPASKRG